MSACPPSPCKTILSVLEQMGLPQNTRVASFSFTLDLGAVVGFLLLMSCSFEFFLKVRSKLYVFKGYLWYRKRPSSFAVLNVDNPVYRRTVEEVDADMDPFADGLISFFSEKFLGVLRSTI